MKNKNIMYDSAEKSPVVLPEMEELLPPLTEEQMSVLERDILRNGCYSPIIVNQDLQVVDGHNRLRLCRKHGIPYRMAVLEFEDLLEAKQWALEAQKGRRNLDKWELGKIALKLKPEVVARAKANMSIGGSKKKAVPKRDAAAGQDSGPQQEPTVGQESAGEPTNIAVSAPGDAKQGLCGRTSLVAEKVNTRQQLADAVGLSSAMMGKIMKIEECAPDAVKEALDKKEISINQAYIAAKYLQTVPEENLEEQTLIALELAKSQKEIKKGDDEANRRYKIATAFSKAYMACNHLRPTVENVACWVDCSRMTRLEIQNNLAETREYAEVFTAIAEILQQFLDAGAGADTLTVLARNQAETQAGNQAKVQAETQAEDQASQNEMKKEEDTAA